MKDIRISDITMTCTEKSGVHALSFREKLELAKLLDRLGADTVETGSFSGGKKDALLLKSLATAVSSAALSVPVSVRNPEAVQTAWDAVKETKHPRLQVCAPVSAVQLEYIVGKKPAALPALVRDTVAACRALCEDVEFVAEDAGRADAALLEKVVSAAVEGGAGCVTFCDTAGTMLPEELGAAVKTLKTQLPETVKLGVYCSNAMYLADACALAAVSAGADEVKVTSFGEDTVSMERFMAVLRQRGGQMGIASHIRLTELKRTMEMIDRMCRSEKSKSTPFETGVRSEDTGIMLGVNDDMTAVCAAAARMGYDLDVEDAARVYEAFVSIASRKEQVGAKELDAIVASAALQVPPTYELESFVINSGNIMGSTAYIQLKKNGQTLKGICVGDGSVDAAFLAIEQIVGCHYELDDFQIQAVTEGREAMGETVVRLRSQGKLYSGRGISTDIVGSSIQAYINAVNKIVYEEAGA